MANTDGGFDSDQNASSMLGGSGAAAPGFDWNALASNPLLLTGLSMIGSNQAVGPAIASGLENAMKVRAANNQNQLQQMQLAQLKARANFNPSQYLLSNQQANVQGNPPPVVGPATLAALAAQGQQPQQSQFAVPQAQNPVALQQAQQIASNAGSAVPPWQPPQGAIGNVDLQSMINAGFKAGMSPEEVQNIAGVIDPMTAIKMKLMAQPALAVAPSATVFSPGAAQAAQVDAIQRGQPLPGGAQAGALYTNPNLPADSDAAQVINITRAMNQYAPTGPNPDPVKYAAMNAMLTQKTGSQAQSIAQQNLQIEKDKTYGVPSTQESTAQAIAVGKAPPITGRQVVTPAGAAIMQRVYQINPNLNGTEYATAENASKAFATGPQGDQVRTFGVASNHLGTLRQAAAALDNGNTPLFNTAKNMIAKATGQPAPTNFNAVRNLATAETVNAITAGGGTQSERDQAQADISGANSPAQLTGVIDRYQSMMADKRAGLQQQYRSATGRDDFDQKFPMPGSSSSPASRAPSPVANFSVADRMAEARRRGLIQ
jgi:hypothetical protein